ncbi:MAG: hypothetical protein PVI50_03565 [Gammaproteobacteria bacterium]|jgi:hypothetical protein
MRGVQEQIGEFFDTARTRFRYSLEDGRVRFSHEVQDFQRRYRVSSLRYLLDADFSSVLTAPVIPAMVVPLAIADLSFTLYQHICIRACGVPRDDYLVIDRHRFAYLNTIEKLNCAYCGDGNGVLAYARRIIARTGQYWCPIRHARRLHGAHDRYPRFFDYGDAESYQAGHDGLRSDLRSEADRDT